MASTTQFQFDGDEPKYKQVASDLRRRIGSGDLEVGVSLGDINAVATYYGCSFGTVSRAEHLLAGEGLLSAIRAGVPTRVIARPTESDQGWLVDQLRKIRQDLDDLIDKLAVK